MKKQSIHPFNLIRLFIYLLVVTIIHPAVAKTSFKPTNIKESQLHWIENKGQVDSAIAFYRVLKNNRITVMKNGTIRYHALVNNEAFTLHEQFITTRQTIHPEGKNQMPAKVNYLKGDASQFNTRIPTYQSVDLGSLWPNIRVQLHANSDNVEKYYLVEPGGKISDITMQIGEVSEICMGPGGTLQMDTQEGGSVSLTAPVAWQEINGTRQFIEVNYKINEEKRTYGFDVDPYDPNYPLIIDPMLSGSYFGGSLWDYIEVMKIGRSGKVYVAGRTVSTDLPVNGTAFDQDFNGQLDMFIGRFDSTLSVLESCTYLGGMLEDYLQDMSLDSMDNVYITGSTASPDFPATANAYDNTFNNPNDAFSRDIVLCALSPELDDLKHATFLGTSTDEYGWALDHDRMQNVIGYGYTWGEIPGIGPQFEQITTGLIFYKFNAELSDLLATNSLAGNAPLYPDPGDLVADSSNNVFFVIETDATDLPTTGEAYSTDHNGASDLYVFRLDNDLRNLLAATYLGGKEDDHPYAVITDSTSHVYISGATLSDDFPVSPYAVDQIIETLETEDALICKLDSNLTTLIHSTLLGGKADEHAYDLELTPDSNIYVTGYTSSDNFPVLCNAFDPSYNGEADAFATCLSPKLDKLLASTYLGGLNYDFAYSIETVDGDTVYISGYTNSTDFPTMQHSYNSVFNGGNADGFVVSMTRGLDDYRPCCSQITYPAPFADNVPGSITLEWTPAFGASGYLVSVGTQAGEFDVLDQFDVGNVMEYPLDELECGQRIYVLISPYNNYGNAEACELIWFDTRDPFFDTSSAEICEGEEYDFHGSTLTASGTYLAEYIDSYGCDSTYELILTVSPSHYSYDFAEICDDDYYSWEGEILTESGLYVETYQNSFGCDSILELELVVHPTYEMNETASICEGDSYTWEGLSLDLPGTYTNHLFTMAGCDSTISLTLDVFENYFFEESYEICPGDTLIWNGNPYDAPGEFLVSYSTVNGCDSNYTLSLSHLPGYEFNDFHTICPGDTFQWQGQNYYESGYYEINYTTILGCDSIFTLDLAVAVPDTMVFKGENTLFVNNDPNSSYQWVTCPGFEPIAGANLPVFTIDSSGTYAVIVEKSGCIDTSECHTIIHTGVNTAGELTGFELYPNPVRTNEVYVKSLAGRQPVRITVFDITGTIILSRNISDAHFKLDVSDLPSGVYWVKYQVKNTVSYKKLVISR